MPNTPMNNIWKRLPSNIKKRIIEQNLPKVRRLPGNLKKLIENKKYRQNQKIFKNAKGYYVLKGVRKMYVNKPTKPFKIANSTWY